jgi:hypothetical protein
MILAAVALLSSASNALPAIPKDQQLTFSNVQGPARIVCLPYWTEGADKQKPSGYRWYDSEYALVSEDGKFIVWKRASVTMYKIDGVADRLYVPHLQTSDPRFFGLAGHLSIDTTAPNGTSTSKIDYGITSTPNEVTNDIGPCDQAHGGAGKDITLRFKTVTLTGQ